MLWFAGCANNSLYHSAVARGQVVQISTSDVVVCIGKRDGAEPEQLLNVYRIELAKGVVEEGESIWQRVHVGKVKIERIIDDHFAKARVIEGKIAWT